MIPKYRVWDSVNKKMHYNDIPVNFDQSIVSGSIFYTLNEFFESMSKKGFIFMSAIGWQDEDGRDIYEGDLTDTGEVRYFDCLHWDGGGSAHPGFYVYGGYEYEGGMYELSYHRSIGTKVKGNIYENPELKIKD